MIVTLDPWELSIGSRAGCARMSASIFNGDPDQNGFFGDGWGAHIDGACAEMAVAKHLGLYWTGAPNVYRKAPDVGPYQVRGRPLVTHNPKPTDNRMIIRPRDKPLEEPYQIWIAVATECPHYHLMGWIYGKYAVQDQWLEGYGPKPKAWFIPYEELNRMAKLPSPAQALELRPAEAADAGA
jgi:hypothetical protein